MTRHIWRALRARLGLTITVVGSLGVGLAATAVLFTVVDAAILRPFPYADPERLVGIGAAYPALNRPAGFFEVVSGPEVEDLKTVAALTDVVGFDLNNESVRIGDGVERVFTAFATGDLMKTLGIEPVVGRAFTEKEVAAGARVAVISHAMWTAQFAADPGAIGRTLVVSGTPYVLVGVAPPRARIYGTDLFVPLTETPGTMARNRRQLNALGRLAPGQSLDDANKALAQLSRQVDTAMSGQLPEYKGFSFVADAWTNIDVWNFRQVAFIAFAAVGAVLLLVTTNLASLLLARASGRRRDAAIHAALGAGQRRIAWQFLGETLAQAAAGAMLAAVLTWLALEAAPAVMPAGTFPQDVTLAINARVWLLLAGGALVTATLVGLVPAWQLSRTAPMTLLSGDSGRAAGSRATTKLHGVIVALEVAIAMIVAAAAGVLASNTAAALRVDPGFDPSNIVIARVTLPPDQYDGERSLQFFGTVLERLRARPDVVAATASNQPPPGVFSRVQFEIAGRPLAASGALPGAVFSTVADGYAETFGARLVAGRWFDERAPMSSPHEVVVNETLAARYWPNEPAIGQRIKIAGPANDGSWADVVGVAADVRNRGLSASPTPEIFGSTRQIPDRRRTQLYLAVRYRGTDAPVIAAMRDEVKSLDPDRPIYAVSSIRGQFDGGLSNRAAAVAMLEGFSALAIGLAALGVFGVLSYAVSQRVREIGIRIALGSDRRAIVALVLARAALPLGVGLAAGAATVVLGRSWLGAWLFGVDLDPLALALAAGVILLVGLAAALRPALAASRLSPIEALRNS